VPHKSTKKCRRGKGDVKLKATQMNHVWAANFQTDETSNGSQLRFSNIVDEYTKEKLLQYVDGSIKADKVVESLDQIVAERGEPQFVRLDNGPEFTTDVITKSCADKMTNTNFIEPGSPWQYAYIESFDGRFRDEILNVERFDSLLEARVVTADWRTVYNTIRPHGSLGGLAPGEFAQTCSDKEKETVNPSKVAHKRGQVTTVHYPRGTSSRPDPLCKSTLHFQESCGIVCSNSGTRIDSCLVSEHVFRAFRTSL